MTHKINHTKYHSVKWGGIIYVTTKKNPFIKKGDKVRVQDSKFLHYHTTKILDILTNKRTFGVKEGFIILVLKN